MTPTFAVRLAASKPLPFSFLSQAKIKSTESGHTIWCFSAWPEPQGALLQRVRDQFAPGSDLGLWSGELRPKAVFFDMDSTVIEQESIVEIAKHIGKSEEVSRITEEAMAGNLDFSQALKARLSLLKGIPVDVLAKVSASLTLTPGIEALVKYCHTSAIQCFLISGGFTDLAGPLAKKLGFAGFHANTLARASGALTGGVEGPIVDGNAKAAYVKEKMDELDLKKENVVVVGDGANDILMMKLGGCAVGFRPKPVLYDHIHVCAGSGDHRFLINLMDQKIWPRV